MKEIDLYKKQYNRTSKKLKKYYNFLEDLPKKLQISERNEYRYNVMINFFKEKKDF
jgi:hypothetical protein